MKTTLCYRDSNTWGFDPGHEGAIVRPPPFARLDPEGSVAHAGVKSQKVGRHFAEMTALLGCELLDLDGVAAYSDLDGIHLEAAGHASVALAVEAAARSTLA